MKLFPTYEGNRPSGLGGDSEKTNKQTDRQTNRGVTSINKIDSCPIQKCIYHKHIFKIQNNTEILITNQQDYLYSSS